MASSMAPLVTALALGADNKAVFINLSSTDLHCNALHNSFVMPYMKHEIIVIINNRRESVQY